MFFFHQKYNDFRMKSGISARKWPRDINARLFPNTKKKVTEKKKNENVTKWVLVDRNSIKIVSSGLFPTRKSRFRRAFVSKTLLFINVWWFSEIFEKKQKNVENNIFSKSAKNHSEPVIFFLFCFCYIFFWGYGNWH